MRILRIHPAGIVSPMILSFRKTAAGIPARIRPDGGRWKSLMAWAWIAIGLCFGCGDDTGALVHNLDTRWTVYARRQCAPLLEHELKGERVHGVVVAFDPDRNLLAYSNVDNFPAREGRGAAIKCIEVQSGRERSTLAGPSESTQCIAFTHDGRYLISGGVGEIELWDLETAERTSEADTGQGYVRCIACSPVGDFVASGGQDGTILIWELAPLRVSQRIVAHAPSGGLRCLRWSSDGNSILSGGWDGAIRLSNATDGKTRFVGQLGYGRVMSVDLSPDGRFGLSTYLNGPDQPVILWDFEEQREKNRFAIPGNPWHANRQLHTASVAFSPDGKTAFFGTAFGSVIWWDLMAWKEIDHCAMYRQEVTHAAFSVDGKQAIAVGGDSDDTDVVPYVRVWELPQESEKLASETGAHGQHEATADGAP